MVESFALQKRNSFDGDLQQYPDLVKISATCHMIVSSDT